MIQILTGVDSNKDYISPKGRNIRFKVANIIGTQSTFALLYYVKEHIKSQERI